MRKFSTGILLVNTGTPAAPEPGAVRRYLAQFLADRRVIDYPRWLWLPLLHGVILRVRPRRSARLYQRVWSETGSPLLYYTRRLAEGLAAWLREQRGSAVPVAAGMRYGEPSIASALRQLRRQGAESLIVLPLFPQYSATTTGSIYDAVSAELGNWQSIPELHIKSNYYNHPAYLEAIAASIRGSWQTRQRPAMLLFSFHGIPQSYVDKGDPYHRQCLDTAALLAERLGLDSSGWQAVFQSRFGPQQWLKPYSGEELRELGEKRLDGLDVVCPGFAVDCLETIDEIGREGRHTFEAAGGRNFHYIPALNDSLGHVQALGEILEPHIL